MCRTYKVSEAVADMYDYRENIENVKRFKDNFTFTTEVKTEKYKEGKKTITKEIHTHRDIGILDVNENIKNQIKLPLNVYKDNTWVDNYTWDNDSSVSVLSLNNNDIVPNTISDYINTVQELEDKFDQEKVLEKQSKSTFNTSKSKVYRLDKNTIVREFTSKYNVVIADVYQMLLKQLPDAAFSARSLGSITPLGLPNKSLKKSEVGKPFGDTANQMSDMDNNDLKNLVDPVKISRFYAVQSTHPGLRARCAEMLMTQDPSKLHDIPISDDEITDTIPAKMLASYLSAIGVEIGDKDEDILLEIVVWAL